MKTLGSRHDIENAIPFLVACAGARMGNGFSKALKPYGISLSEWRVCASLQHSPQQALSELAERVASDLSAVSRIVERLVVLELVARARCEMDGRSVRLALTPQGETLTHEIVPLAQHYEDVALSDFNAAEVKRLRSLLLRLYKNASPLA